MKALQEELQLVLKKEMEAQVCVYVDLEPIPPIPS